MSKPTERIIKANGISLNVVEQGQGPLVLLCHGSVLGQFDCGRIRE